jgi:hypothetical protein
MTEGKIIRPEVVASLLPRMRPAAAPKRKTAVKQKPAAAAVRKK